MISSFFYMFYNRDFNSIKVRLEPSTFTNFSFDIEFQFHKGAIRTMMQRMNMIFHTLISIP